MTILRLLMSRVSCAVQYRNNIAKSLCFKKLTECRVYSTTIKLKIDSENVVSSGLADIRGFENVNLYDLIWNKMELWSNKTALVCSVTGRSYTYSQLRKACGRLATSLRKNNLLPGDKIGIVLPNIPEFAIITLAGNEAGLCITLISPLFTVHEIQRQLENSDAKAVFTIPAKYKDVQSAIEQNPKIKLPIIVINDGTDTSAISGAIKFDDLIRADVEEFSVNQKTCIKNEDTLFLPSSSGTTGLPKLVELTNRNLVANVLQSSNTSIFSGIEANAYYQEIVPLVLPMYHAYALTICLYNYLRIGAKLVCIPRFSSTEFIKVLETYQPTALYIVPPILQMMTNNVQITSRHVETVKLIILGAARIGEKYITDFKSRISNTIPIVQGYGLTETSPCVSRSINAPPESCGYLMPNTQLRIVERNDDINKNLGIRGIGEIYIRGPQVMKGYYKNPKATADTMEGDWLKTGDLGFYTADGLIYITGRLKELIKVKGYQVSPAELEDVISKYDRIKDVAVIGVQHDKYGEIPKAFVVAKPGLKINEDDLKKFVAERVAKYKELGYVQVVESIPKSPAGKILRKELYKM